MHNIGELMIYDKSYYQCRGFCNEAMRLRDRKERFFNLEWASKWSGLDLMDGRGRKALDAGCGMGQNTFPLDELHYEVTAIDVSEYAIQELQTAAARLGKTTLHLIRTDLDQDPIPGRFDLVLCWDVIEHACNPEQVVSRLYDSLLPGGLLVIATPNSLGLSHILLDRDPPPTHVHSPFYWARLLRRLPGAKNIVCRSFIFRDHILPWLRKRSKALVTWFPILGLRLRMAAQRLTDRPGPADPKSPSAG